MDRHEYSERMKFEHELINRRVTWLLTSQSILFAAYGIALNANASSFLGVVAFTGAMTAVFVLVGILASFAAKFCTWKDFQNSGNQKEPFWVRTPITYLGFVPDFMLPILFAIVWVYLSWK